MQTAMKYILYIIIITLFTSLNVWKQKLWLCSTIINKPNEVIHAPRVVSAKDFKEARKKYLYHLMHEALNLKGGVIDTREECLMIQEIQERTIVY